MGHALVFDGLVIENPIGTVTFVEDDGLSEVTRSYFRKLSIDATPNVKMAFEKFYQSLKSANLWDDLFCFYPMFGSRNDCSVAFVGDNISIPDGATYDKGIQLTGCSVTLVSPWKESAANSGHTFYQGLPYKGNKSKGRYIVGFTTKDQHGGAAQFSYNREGRLIGLSGSYVNLAESDTVIGYALQRGEDTLYNGTTGQTQSATIGDNVNSNWGREFGLNITASQNVTTPINMVMIFKSYHSSDEASIVVNAIKELQSVF